MMNGGAIVGIMIARGGQLHEHSGVRADAKPFGTRLVEIGMFFQGNDAIHHTMRRVAAALDRAGISYAIVGGMAVNAHRHSRTTKDVDLLLAAQGFSAFKQLVAAGEFQPVAGRPRRFTDTSTGVTFDILVAGQFPGTGAPGPIAFPEPSAVTEEIDRLRVVNLPTLVQLKLAARRYQDFADVVNLIRENRLDESFADQLHPAVRTDYVLCLDEMRREDEYESRRDRLPDEP
jgi:hypothetical protein